MTCAQGLLRLLWGGPEVGVLRDWYQRHIYLTGFASMSSGLISFYLSSTILELHISQYAENHRRKVQ